MKLLVLSHNPLTTYESMGKTLATLLSSLRREEMCQLYIYPTVPDVDLCSSFYRITDKDVLRSYYRFKVSGKEIAPDPAKSEMFENAADERVYRNPKNKKPGIMLARDLMWKCSRWFNRDLRAWLDREKPDCILAAPGTAKFFYDIALKISEAYHIPVISYLCDEYYFVKTPKQLGERLQVRLLQKKIEKYMGKISRVITICDELKQLYAGKFALPITTVMTGSSFPISQEKRGREKPQAITYMGNVRCGRYRSILEIGAALEEINIENGTEYKVKVYCSEKNEEILAALKSCKAVELCGFVSGAAFDKALHGADFLLHTESFDPACIDEVRNSVSTKIADSLASGVPLIAYGPAEVASMGHLIRNRSAIIVTDRAQLKDTLKRAFTDRQYVEEVIGNALLTAKRYHDCAVCGGLVRAELTEALRGRAGKE